MTKNYKGIKFLLIYTLKIIIMKDILIDFIKFNEIIIYMENGTGKNVKYYFENQRQYFGGRELSYKKLNKQKKIKRRYSISTHIHVDK